MRLKWAIKDRVWKAFVLVMRNGVFPAISIDKGVTVISDSSPPGHSGRSRIPGDLTAMRLQLLPTQSPKEVQDVRTQDQSSLVQTISHVWLFVTPWTAARHASLSITNSWGLLKYVSVESVMPSNYPILCCPLSPPAFNLSQYQDLFQWVGSSHQVAKVLELQFQHQSFQWILRIDFL